MSERKKLFITALSVLLTVVVAITLVLCPLLACGKKDATENTTDSVTEDSDDTDDEHEQEGSGDDVTSEPPAVELTRQLSEIKFDYGSTGTNAAVFVDKAAGGEKLSLYSDGEETEFDTGFFAHAYSVIVFDGLSTQGYTEFSTYFGAHKTARTANTVTDIVFRIFVDNVEKFTSATMTAYSDYGYAEVDITGADRLTLVADGLDRIGNDHAVWADCKLSYYDAVKPKLLADDIEMPNASCVTRENILQMARAESDDGTDLTDRISFTTDYVKGETGEFEVEFTVTDDVGATAAKTVKLKVYDQSDYTLNASLDYLTTPFANYLYYGRSLLDLESRKAYDKIMETMLKTDISDPTVNSVSIDLQANGIYVLPNKLSLIKTYMLYDEARLYYLYDWRSGYEAGISYDRKDGLVKSVSLSLNNGANGYYYGHDNMKVYADAEKEVYETYMSKLSPDMTDAQKLYVLHNANNGSMRYSNVNYADGFYGAFITKNCICSGYAKGLQYLAHRVGIRGAYVANATHAWNNFFVEGKWYSSDSTGVGADSNGLLGVRAGTAPANFSIMPEIAETDYDRNLQKYGLMTVRNAYLIKAGETFDAIAVVDVPSSVSESAPVVSATYTGALDMSRAGKYTVTVNAENALGNKVSGECNVCVYESTELLDSSFTPVTVGNTGYEYKPVSLYSNGKEREFKNGLYTKANGKYRLNYDISERDYKYFSGYVSINGNIRQGEYGYYAASTITIYADGIQLWQTNKMGWKDEMKYFALELPQGTSTLTLEIIDDVGQGGVGWGDCMFYL